MNEVHRKDEKLKKVVEVNDYSKKIIISINNIDSI
jgi:hypothetical protein